MLTSEGAIDTQVVDDQPSASQLEQDPRWLLALRVSASRSFSKSSFLTSFLLYVCDRELRGLSHEITEHQIGIHAFNRPSSYNPGEDNIVRNYARLLRKRLDEYFESEGKDEPLRIKVPRGRYVPVFYLSVAEQERLTPSLVSAEASLDPEGNDDGTVPAASTIAADRPVPRMRLLLVVIALVVVCSAVWLGVRFFHRTPATLSHHLWSQIFSRNRETLIVPADSGLGILQNLSHHPVHLSDYVNGVYLSKIDHVPGLDSRNFNDLSTQRYTSVVDLNVASSLSRLPELVPDHFSIRYARDLRMEDLKHSNAILLGSLHTNPWVELFQKNMNFVLDYQPEVDNSVVLNRHPRAGESAVYKNAWDEDSHRTYAVLAFVPSLDGLGNTILVEGLNMAGTQAAADFLLNDHAMAPILEKSMQPDGSFGPFELLLETNNIGANAPEAWVVAGRYGSPSAQ